MTRFQEVILFLVVVIALTPFAFLLMPILVPVLLFAGLVVLYRIWTHTDTDVNENH